MHTNSNSKSRLPFIAAVLAAALAAASLAGCAGAPPPYQARSEGGLGYGYADSKIDASHYAVLYTDSNPQRAEENMKLRAAQVAQAAGFSYFAIDVKGAGAQRQTETQFNLNQLSDANRKASDRGAGSLNAYLDPNTPSTQKTFYSAAARISLLTPQQAQGNPNAIAVTDVLSKAVPTDR